MKYIIPLLAIAIGVTIFCSHTAWGQSLTNYLQDKSDSVLRIELVTPPGITPPEATLWGRLKKLIGIRQVARIQPPVGTKLTVQASAYASSPYQTDNSPCVTAAGTRVRPGVVATNFLPLGTILEINGLEFIVEDRMNSRYDGYYMDLWFPSTSSALTFGRKKLEITITGYGKPGQEIRSEQVAVEVEKKSFFDRMRDQIAAIGQLLGARTPEELNRHDVDCLSEN
jgi:3D (Asp-Asp-Asp) domain-containing protein